MSQGNLFDVGPRFDGETYEPKEDQVRLGRQMSAVKTLMLDGRWRSLSRISEILGYPEASISARIRHLRKPRFGGYEVERRRVSGGLFEYRVEVRE